MIKPNFIRYIPEPERFHELSDPGVTGIRTLLRAIDIRREELRKENERVPDGPDEMIRKVGVTGQIAMCNWVMDLMENVKRYLMEIDRE